MRKIQFGPQEFFHIYNRGTERRKIFIDSEDNWRFLKSLYLCNSNHAARIRGMNIFGKKQENPLVHIVAYCLMPNHFHLLVQEVQGGGISKFMHKLQTSYTMYFNKRYDRDGVLFQGPFKAKHIDSDRYMRRIFAYIHLNPLGDIEKQESQKFTDNFIADQIKSHFFSSYYDYFCEDRLITKIINKKVLPIEHKDLNIQNLCKENERLILEEGAEAEPRQ